jgi:AcrR family transcriptional regulator
MAPAKRTKRTRAKNCPSAQLRKKVDETAFALFLERGYENTTMRIISEETGFGAGSLYNTFNGKEDILLDIILSAYDTTVKKVKALIKEDEDPLVAINVPMCVMIYAASVNVKYAELFTVATHNWKILNAMVDKTVAWKQNFFKTYNKDITKEEMKASLLANASVMGRYFLQYKEEGPMDCREGITMCMKFFCILFGVVVIDINAVVDKIVGLFDEQMMLGLFDITPDE